MGLACRMHEKHIKIIGIYTYRPTIKTLWVKFEVLMTLNMNIPVIWDEMPWRYPELYRRFGRSYCVYLQRTKRECTLHV
jgi:hypothetical protein